MYSNLFVPTCMPSFHHQQLGGVAQTGFAPQVELANLVCQQYALNLMNGIIEVLSDPHLQDVIILCCDGRSVRSNKLLLAAWSPYFRQVLALQGNEVYLPGITSEVFDVLLVFMYRGNVQVSSYLLPSVMEAATTLQIRASRKHWLLFLNIL